MLEPLKPLEPIEYKLEQLSGPQYPEYIRERARKLFHQYQHELYNLRTDVGQKTALFGWVPILVATSTAAAIREYLTQPIFDISKQLMKKRPSGLIGRLIPRSALETIVKHKYGIRAGLGIAFPLIAAVGAIPVSLAIRHLAYRSLYPKELEKLQERYRKQIEEMSFGLR